MIEIKDEIFDFDLFDQDKKMELCKTKTLISAPEPVGWVSKQLIGFFTKYGAYVKLDLAGVSENSHVFALYWKYFSNVELEKLAELFDLKISKAENINRENNATASIQLKTVRLSAQVSIKECPQTDSQYIAIYHLSQPDKIFENKLYVQGIWQVSMSKELLTKLLSRSK